MVYSVLNELAQVYDREGRFAEAATEYSVSGNHRAAGNCYIELNDHLRALNSFEQIDGVKKYLALLKARTESGKEKTPVARMIASLFGSSDSMDK